VISDPTEVCTISGPVYSDSFSISTLTAQASIGAIDSQSPPYPIIEEIDGLLGMVGSTSFGMPLPIDALAQAGMIQDQFAFCFANRTHGKFMLGGAESGTYNPKQLTWLPFSSSQGGYSVYMTGLQFGATNIGGFNQQDVILDSGTNQLLLDDTSLSQLTSVMSSCTNCAHVNGLINGNCFNLTQAQVAAYPSLSLFFGNLQLVMPPAAYLVENPAAPYFGARCLAIASGGNLIIVGDTTMWSYVTIFDRTNARVGFAPVNVAACAS